MIQQITAIHDGSTQGWHTAYVAFNMAARLSASLLVISLADGEADAGLVEQIARIEIGARAAGLSFETVTVHSVSVDAIVARAEGTHTLLLPRDLLNAESLALALVEALSCPVWLIPGELEIRRLGIILNDPGGEEYALQYASALAYRWNQPLICLARKPGPVALSQDSKRVEFIWSLLDDLSAAAIEQEIGRKQLDMLVFTISQAWLVSELAGQTASVLVLCPKGAVHAFN